MLLTLALAFAQDTISDAENPPINVQHLRPTLDGRYTLWADDSARQAHKQLFGRTLFHYARQPLVYRYDDGEVVRLVNNVLQGDLIAGFAYDRVRFGVDLPIYFYADGDDRASQSGTGDLAVDTKVTVLDEEGGPGVAFSGRLTLPTSSVRNVLPLGSPTAGWEIAAIVDQEIGDFFVTGNLGVRGGPRAVLENVKLDDFFLFRAAGAYRFDEKSSVALELAGDVPFSKNAGQGAPIEALADVRTHVAPDLQVRLGLGTSLTTGVGAPDFRVLVGFAWHPMPDRDLDDDGIEDDVDQCVDKPEDKDGEDDTDGCPEDRGSVAIEVLGADGKPLPAATVSVVGSDRKGTSGLVVEQDSGPVKIAAAAEGYLPAEVEVQIVDADVERAVQITLEPIPMGTVKVKVEDIEGAPIAGASVQIGETTTAGATAEAELVAGEKTPVRATAEGYRASQKQYVELAKGETKELVLTLEKVKAELKGDRIDLRESVFFDLGKATIQERSYPLLEQVVAILNEHPELTKLRIEGHTDSRGSASANKKLSQSRADAVKVFLVEKGIAAERLDALGFGEERPIDPGKTEEAYARNRRVDFFVAERTD
ncbi:MAG: OmpA family protein [Alphaproteobacteria bacterium]|nr:OmpA family protein [Alphaproteobacteria bacterium]